MLFLNFLATIVSLFELTMAFTDSPVSPSQQIYGIAGDTTQIELTQFGLDTPPGVQKYLSLKDIDTPGLLLQYGRPLLYTLANRTMTSCVNIHLAIRNNDDFNVGLNTLCLMLPNPPLAMNYTIRRFASRPNLAEIENHRVQPNIDYNTVMFPETKNWEILHGSLVEIYLVSITPNVAANTTTVRYQIMKLLSPRLILVNSATQPISEMVFTTQGIFQLLPKYKVIASCADHLIIMNTVNTSLPYDGDNAQAANNVILVIFNSTRIWNGVILTVNLTHGDSSPVRHIFDMECRENNLFVMYPRNETATSRSIVVSTFTLKKILDTGTQTSVDLDSTGTGSSTSVSNRVLVPFEMTYPFSFMHFALLETKATVGTTYTPTLYVVRHVPGNSSYDGRIEFYNIVKVVDTTVVPNTATINFTPVGTQSVVHLPQLANKNFKVDIKVLTTGPITPLINILYFINGKLRFLDFITSVGVPEMNPNIARVGPLILFRVPLVNCSSAHISFSSKIDIVSSEGVFNYLFRLFCLQNGIGIWFKPSSLALAYSAITTFPNAARVDPVRVAPIFQPSATLNFSSSLYSIDLRPYASIFTNVSVLTPVKYMKVTKNTVYALPFFFKEIRGANLTIESTDNNSQILYLNYKQQMLRYPTRIDNFDIDEVFPVAGGAIASHDFKALAFLSCTERADFELKTFTQDCQLTATFNMNFLKVVSVQDYAVRCSCVLIVIKNTQSTNNEHLFLIFNYQSNAFEQKGSLTDKDEYIFTCYNSGGTNKVWLAVGWKKYSFENSTVVGRFDRNWELVDLNPDDENGLNATQLNTSYTDVTGLMNIHSMHFLATDKENKENYLFYFTQYKANGVTNLIRMPLTFEKVGEGTKFYITNQGSSILEVARYQPPENGQSQACLLTNYHLVWQTPLKSNSTILAYSNEVFGPNYYSNLKYDMADYNLTNVTNVTCHSLKDLDTFVVYGRRNTSSGMHSVFLIFVVEPASDQRLFTIITRPFAVSSAYVTEDSTGSLYLILRATQSTPEYWRIQPTKEQTLVSFKDINFPNKTLPQSIPLNFTVKNDYVNRSLTYVVTFEDSAILNVSTKSGVNFTDNRTWNLIPDLLFNITGPLLDVKVILNTSHPDGATISRSRIQYLGSVNATKPATRTPTTLPRVVRAVAKNVEVLYIQTDDKFYVYYDRKLLEICNATLSPNQNPEVLQVLVHPYKEPKIWIVYSTPSGEMMSLMVNSTRSNPSVSACSLPSWMQMYDFIENKDVPSFTQRTGKNFMLVPPTSASDTNIFYVSNFTRSEQEIGDWAFKELYYFCDKTLQPVKNNSTDHYQVVICYQRSPQSEVVKNNPAANFDFTTKRLTFCTLVSRHDPVPKVYQVCLGAESEDVKVLKYFAVASYYSNSSSFTEAVFSTADIPSDLITEIGNGINCTLLVNNTITCAVIQKLSSTILQFFLEPTTPTVPNRFNFIVGSLRISYDIPLGLMINALSISESHILAFCNKKQGIIRLDDTITVAFLLGRNLAFYSLNIGKYPSLSADTLAQGFFGNENNILYSFDSKSMEMKLYELTEFQLRFTVPNSSNVTSSLLFESDSMSNNVSLRSIFYVPPPVVSNITISPPPPPQKSFLEKYWVYVVVAGVVTAIGVAGLTVYCIRREKLKRDIGIEKALVINRLEDFMF